MAQPVPGGWNRIHLIVDNLDSEIDRLRTSGLAFRNDVVAGPGGCQILLTDPAGNLIELFEPAQRHATTAPARPEQIRHWRYPTHRNRAAANNAAPAGGQPRRSRVHAPRA
jgi:hypothetical protein